MTFNSIVGVIGLIILQANYIPSVYGAIVSGYGVPMQSAVLALIGLSLMLYQSIKQRMILYIFANLIGVIFNALLIIFMW